MVGECDCPALKGHQKESIKLLFFYLLAINLRVYVSALLNRFLAVDLPKGLDYVFDIFCEIYDQ